MIKIIIFFLVFCSISNGMLGGVEVRPHDPLLPSFAGIYVRNKDTARASLCTGTFISKNQVLTAAHCFNIIKGATHYEIILSNSKNPFQFLVDPLVPRVVTKKYKVYPPYLISKTKYSRMSSDIAIVQIETNTLSFNQKQKPLPLIYSGAIRQLPNSFQIYATGDLGREQTSISNYMFRKENFNLVPENIMKLHDTAGLYNKSSSGVFVVTHDKTVFQQGDSGGSALANRRGIPTIIGVLGAQLYINEIAIGFGFANINEPKLNKWIRSQLN